MTDAVQTVTNSTIEIHDGMRVAFYPGNGEVFKGYRTIRKGPDGWEAHDGLEVTAQEETVLHFLSNGTYRPVTHAEDNPATLRPTQASPGAWLNSLSSEERKECAVSRGFFAYFPDAIAIVARHSVRMNQKHNPGEPVHWARGKSTDQPDCEGRHLIATSVNHDAKDADGAYEMVCKAWRAMADLQEWVEKKHAAGEKI